MKIKSIIFQYTIIIAALISVLALGSCKGDEPTPPQTQARRTVLVYQVANNNLGTSRYNDMDIEEMKDAAKAGKIPSDCHLLVYSAGPSDDPVLFEIKGAKNDTIKTYSNDIYSVQSERMLEVFADMEAKRPAQDYGLVLWSHGSGWIQDGMSDPLDSRGEIMPLSFGSDRRKSMNVTTLSRTLQKGPQFSFLYFDCCYMASIETLYELGTTIPVIAASATELLVYGMPYDQNVECFFAREPDIIGAATNTFNLYDKETGSNRTCTMSVIKTEGLSKIAEVTKEIYSRANGTMAPDFRPQRFMNTGISNCTYFDFRHYVAALCLDSNGEERFEGAAALLSDFDRAISQCVVYAAATPMLWNVVDLTYHCGLSTYILKDAADSHYKNYNTLSWYADVASRLNFK